MRLIDADAITYELWTTEVDSNRDNYRYFQNRYMVDRRDIESMPTVQQWIPCSERQPDLSGYYLVTEKGAMEPDFVTVGCYYRGNTNLDDKWLKETGYPMEVTAWMELPEPYGGDDQ